MPKLEGAILSSGLRSEGRQTMRAPRRRIQTEGRIDSIGLSGDRLRIYGWIRPQDEEEITRLDVSLGGKAIEDVAVQLGLSSADVAAARPGMPGADRARFVVEGQADPLRVRDSMLAITPVMGDVEGTILYRLPETRPPEPAASDILTVGGGFEHVGLEFLGLFVQLAGLEPGDAVLDVGCGCGRMAYALAYYLDDGGRYEGFDVCRRLVDWASQSITRRYPRFQFRWVDICNPQYNPEGRDRSESFSFPYESGCFDLVFLGSVFTHLQAAEVRHYLDEIVRTLKPGGVCAATYFLLDDEARRQIERGLSSQAITKRLGECYTTDLQTPEACIGYEPDQVHGWMAERGLHLVSEHPGSWCGRPMTTTYQDLLIARK